MPLYQYICQACGHEFEVMTSMDKRDEAVCPKCGGAVKRSWMGACAFGNMKYALTRRFSPNERFRERGINSFTK